MNAPVIHGIQRVSQPCVDSVRASGRLVVYQSSVRYGQINFGVFSGRWLSQISAQLERLLFAGLSLYLVRDGPAAETGYGVLRMALAQRRRWELGQIALSGHRQVVLVRPAASTLVLHVLHYPEQVRVCQQTVWPLAKEPAEELPLAGMLIEAWANGRRCTRRRWP